MLYAPWFFRDPEDTSLEGVPSEAIRAPPPQSLTLPGVNHAEGCIGSGCTSSPVSTNLARLVMNSHTRSILSTEIPPLRVVMGTWGELQASSDHSPS